MENGKIILLNGTSSSGKRAIVTQLQAVLDEPYLSLSIDNFLHNLPERYMSDEGKDILVYDQQVLSELFPRLISGIHECIPMLASKGINLIVDHVIQRRDWLEELVELLEGYEVRIVGVRCSLDELERREKSSQRADGLARTQFDVVHDIVGDYVLEVDTCTSNEVACAQQIKKMLETNPSPRACDRIRSQLVN